jgi:hypothetical protein
VLHYVHAWFFGTAHFGNFYGTWRQRNGMFLIQVCLLDIFLIFYGKSNTTDSCKSISDTCAPAPRHPPHLAHSTRHNIILSKTFLRLMVPPSIGTSQGYSEMSSRDDCGNGRTFKISACSLPTKCSKLAAKSGLLMKSSSRELSMFLHRWR